MTRKSSQGTDKQAQQAQNPNCFGNSFNTEEKPKPFLPVVLSVNPKRFGARICCGMKLCNAWRSNNKLPTRTFRSTFPRLTQSPQFQLWRLCMPHISCFSFDAHATKLLTTSGNPGTINRYVTGYHYIWVTPQPYKGERLQNTVTRHKRHLETNEQPLEKK